MKKFTLILIFMISSCTFFSFQLKPSIAKAQNYEYFRVLSENVYIYQDSLCSQKLFEVPKTYYVKAESITQEYARVSFGYENSGYPVIIGYMKIGELTVVENTPTNPYNLIKVSTALSDILFNDPNLKNAYFNVPTSTFMTYYGNYNLDNGTKLCFVYCNNKLGYIDANSLNPFTLPLNSDPLPSENVETNTDVDENIENETLNPPSSLKGEGLQIIIIVGISIICISIVYTLFKPSKNKVYKREPVPYEDDE
ncbi:MAG: hypothetical protein IKV61_05270 [Clostridia bacterium]|nr:hypothetical protein [Clostridia bacterium]